MSQLNGIINVLKPPSMTSHDVIAYLRRLLGTKSIGHTGTLDPGVPGVLPVCVGNATRVAEFLTEAGKSYRAEITFGVRTSTQDSFGETLSQQPVQFDYEQASSIIPAMTGWQKQIPPMVSAVKSGGKRLYELAREGKEVERQPRDVYVEYIKVMDSDWSSDNPSILFDVACSKGTYIRTLCNDWGDKLGCAAHMSYLIRTKSGSFELASAWTLAEILAAVSQGDMSFLLPMDVGLGHFPALKVREHRIKALLNGLELARGDYQPMQVESTPGDPEGWVRLYSFTDQLLALGTRDKDGRIRPKKVFTRA